MNPITKIPDQELTHTLYQKGEERAQKEKEWIIVEHERPILLAQITEEIADREDCSHAVAERKARVSERYKNHIQKMGEVKAELFIARAKYDAVDHEIRMRINKSFTDRSEYQGGRLQT